MLLRRKVVSSLSFVVHPLPLSTTLREMDADQLTAFRYKFKLNNNEELIKCEISLPIVPPFASPSTLLIVLFFGRTKPLAASRCREFPVSEPSISLKTMFVLSTDPIRSFSSHSARSLPSPEIPPSYYPPFVSAQDPNR